VKSFPLTGGAEKTRSKRKKTLITALQKELNQVREILETAKEEYEYEPPSWVRE